MAWLPFERYVITTPLTRTQIEQNIANLDGNTDYYTVTRLNNVILVDTSDRFQIGGYHQSFKPRATIQIEVTSNGTNLKVVLRPRLQAVAILTLVVVLFLAAIGYTQRINIALGRYQDAIVACIGLLILAYLLPVTAFNSEVAKLKLFITDLFEVELEN